MMGWFWMLTHCPDSLQKPRKCRDALKYLRLLNCKYRLSREVLHYGIPPPGAPPPPADNCSAKLCRGVDGALPAEMLAHLRRAFEPGSPFWSEHGYNEETSGAGGRMLCPCCASLRWGGVAHR